MKVLVTGGSGFIGKVLVRKLKEQGVVVSELNKSEGNDIRDCNLDSDFDMIFHLASGISVKESIEKTELYFDTILWGTYRLLEKYKGIRFVNISSNSAVDFFRSPYGLFKQMSEFMTDRFPNTISLRPYHVFGEGERKRVIHAWARAMLLNQGIEIFGDGTMTRDYTYVEDVADAIIEYGLSTEEIGVIPIGYSKGTTLNELFEIMSGLTGYKKKPIYRPTREGDSEISISPVAIKGIGFEAGLKKTIDYLRTEYAA